MSLTATPNGDRVQIAIFGRRNAGKSSVINAVTGQQLAIVSDVKGTTTDPVYMRWRYCRSDRVCLLIRPDWMMRAH